MESNKSPESKEVKIICGKCGEQIPKGQDYYFDKKVLCENCCLSLGTRRTRKAHRVGNLSI